MLFVYVFSDEARDKLTEAGFRLMNGENNGLYLFENRSDIEFDWEDMEHVFTNTLLFC